MLERVSDLRLDPVISEQFFDYKEVTGIHVDVDFPLPPDAIHLQAFLASPDGTRFKQGFTNLVDNLAAWATSNGINSASCGSFKSRYVNYDGADDESNNYYIALYQEGVPSLSGIIKLINLDTINLDYRKDKIRNLLAGINVCGPGSHTNITDAYLELLAHSNMPAKWLAMRRKICEQLVLELIKPVNVPTTMEIHYVNAVINRYSDALAIQMINDPNVKHCPAHKLNGLIDKFANELQKHLTTEAIISCIRSEPDFYLSKKEVSPDNLIEFERKLNVYGTEDEENAFFSVHAMLAAEKGEVAVPYHLSWCADYIIDASLFNRLTRSGYFNAINPLKFKLGEASVNAIAEHSFNLAYVDLPPSDNLPAQRQAFIPYFIHGLLDSEDKRKQFIRTLADNKISNAHRYDIAQGLIRYLNSFEFDHHPNKKALLGQLANSIHDILPDEKKWYQIAASLPEAGKQFYLDKFSKSKLSSLIMNVDELVMVLKCKLIGTYQEILWKMPLNILQPILSDGKKIKYLLEKLNNMQRAAVFMQVTRPITLRSVASVITDLKQVPLLLPVTEYTNFLNAIDRSSLIKLVLFYSKYHADFLKILDDLQDSAQTLLLLAGPETIRDIQPTDKLLLKIMQILPPENRASYLLTLNNLSSIVSGKDSDFFDIFLLLPEHARPALLEKLEIEALRKFITTFDKLELILKSLPGVNRLTLLQRIGAETITKLLTDSNKLVNLLSLIPANNHAVLMVMGIIPANVYGVCIKDAASLTNLLRVIPLEFHADFLGRIKDTVRALITDKNQLVTYIAQLPKPTYKALINAIGNENLHKIFSNPQDFSSALVSLPPSCVDDFILLFTPEFLSQVCINRAGLTILLKEIPPQFYSSLFNKMGTEKLASLIVDAGGLGEMLKIIPEQNYRSLLQAMKPELISQIFTNYKTLRLVCNGLPAVKAIAFYDALQSDLMRGLIHDAREYNYIFKKVEGDHSRFLNKILQNSSNPELHRFIRDLDELIFVFYHIPESDRLNLLNRLDNHHLEQILFKNKDFTDVMNKIKTHSRDSSHYNILLLAFLHAYREHRAHNPKKYLHWYGGLFFAPTRDAKLAETDKLIAVIKQGDHGDHGYHGYFDRLNDEQKNTLLDGRLGQIASEFRRGRWTR